MRKFFFCVPALALVLAGFPLSAQFRPGHTSELNDSETVSVLKRHVSVIASEGNEGRAPGSEGERAVASYLHSVLESYGAEMLCSSDGDVFGISEGDTLVSRNVLGIVQGTDPKLKDRYIVVGARMDNLGVNNMTVDGKPFAQIYYGANGNGSGLAAMLELARLVSTNSVLFRRSVIFIGFGASTKASAGSWYFLNRSFKETANIDAMVNLDALGGGDSFQAYTSSNEDMNTILKGVASSLQPVLPKIVTAEAFPSDHRSFYAAGIPSVLFTTGLYPEYNSARDVPSIIDYDGLEKELEYLYNYTLALANVDDAPIFNLEKLNGKSGEDRIYGYYDCDRKPTFMGHSDPRFFIQQWVYQYLKYPNRAVEEGIQGRVVVQFIIGKDGTVSDIRVTNEVDSLLAEEAVRVISASPKWKPGLVKGEPVRSSISIPVYFKLTDKRGKFKIN